MARLEGRIQRRIANECQKASISCTLSKDSFGILNTQAEFFKRVYFNAFVDIILVNDLLQVYSSKNNVIFPEELYSSKKKKILRKLGKKNLVMSPDILSEYYS